jgi:hypothetical protein
VMWSHREYEQISTNQVGDDSNAVEGPSFHSAIKPPERPPPSAGFVAAARAGSGSKPSRPPPAPGFVAAQRGGQAASFPSPSRVAASASSALPQRDSAARADVAPPSRPPPSRDFVASQQLRSTTQRPQTSPPQQPPFSQRPSASRAAEEKPQPAARSSGNVEGAASEAEKSERARHFHAQVGHNVSRQALEEMLTRLIHQARFHFHQKEFEEALVTFKHALSIAEKTTIKGRHAEYGAIAHNIASCLHCLGDFDSAKDHYHLALNAFQREAPSRWSLALYGDIDHKRCQFVKERLVDIEFGRKPDLDKFLDGYGQKRDVTPDIIAGNDPHDRDPLRTHDPRFGLGMAMQHPFGGPIHPGAIAPLQTSRLHTSPYAGHRRHAHDAMGHLTYGVGGPRTLGVGLGGSFA